MISTPGGRPAFSVSSFSLTAAMVTRAFWSERRTTTPPTASPSPSSSPMPRRISGPVRIVATSPSVTGVAPASLSGMARKSARVSR